MRDINFGPIARLWIDTLETCPVGVQKQVNALGLVVEDLPPLDFSCLPDFFESVRGAEVMNSVGDLADQWMLPYQAGKQVEYANRDRWPDAPIREELVRSRTIGEWWSFPTFLPMKCFRSCTTPGPYFGGPCVAAFGFEDATFSSPWLEYPVGTGITQGHPTWRAFKEPLNPKILEIDGQSSWIDLVETYPLRSAVLPEFWKEWFGADNTFVTVDWFQVANDYDGVHMTQLGYLGTAYAPMKTTLGLTTVAGWDPDATFWLR